MSVSISRLCRNLVYRSFKFLLYHILLIFQFIIGLGVPVDLKEASVTVGTVIKFQYDLPTNSSQYTSRIYGFVETVSRDMDGDTANEDDNSNTIDIDDSRKLNEVDDNVVITDIERDNDTLVDITFEENRRRRSLIYTEGGMIDTGDRDISTELPLQEAIRRQELIDQNNMEEEEEPQRMNRWDFYKILEHMVER